MKGALIILLATILIGIVLYIHDRRRMRKTVATGSETNNPDGSLPRGDVETEVVKGEEECCGQHAVCEKTSLSPLDTKVVYYDDEELDRFKGREPLSYSPEEVEEFREILMTLLPEDVAGWSRSLQVREISLPIEVRDELLMIVGELRGQQSMAIEK